MKSYKNNIVGSKKIVGRGKAALAATIAAMGLGIGTAAMGAVADVKAITTLNIPGSGSTQNGVAGAGSAGSGFTSSKNYNETYQGNDLEITKITTATTSYMPSALASTVVDRSMSTTNNTDTIFYAGSGNSSSTSLTFKSSKATSVAQAFSGNNLLVGADNLFTNQSNAQNNNTNIERMDFIFPAGISASAATAFAIFERGITNQHDAFKIAAITGISGSTPTHYGTVVSLTSGGWGLTNVEPNSEYLVTRKNDQVVNDTQHPSDMVNQPIGGVVIPTNTLATAGTTIFGYSLFAGDVTGTGDQLVNWMNTTFFPSTTTETTGGGLDTIGTAAVLYTSAVPEPTTGTLALLGISGLLARRSKRKAV